MSLKWLPTRPPLTDLVGIFVVEDLITKTVPISIPGTDTLIRLNNDGLGPETTDLSKPAGLAALWQTVAGDIDYSPLSVGDFVQIGIDIAITTISPNTEIHLEYLGGIGTSPTSQTWQVQDYKSAGVHDLYRCCHVTMDNDDVVNGRGEFHLMADKACDVEIRKYSFLVTKRTP